MVPVRAVLDDGKSIGMRSVGLTGAEVRYGTPSWSLGTSKPCQWKEVSVSIRLCTRITAVSPSVKCNVGPGMFPLMVMAWRVAPVKLTGAFRTYKSYSTVFAREGEKSIGKQHRNGRKWKVRVNMNGKKHCQERPAS